MVAEVSRRQMSRLMVGFGMNVKVEQDLVKYKKAEKSD